MMRQDKFTEGASVILSGDHALARNQRLPRRNLGWGSFRARRADASLRSE